MKRAGFSLVELLVVLGIISLLAALLFPVLASARERARTKTCISNMRQLGQATLLYLPDWNDTYPLAGYISTDPQNQRCLMTLFHELVPYIKNKQIVLCPSDGAPVNVERVFSQVMPLCPAMGFKASSYMANWCLFEVGDLAPGTPHPPVSHAQIPFPAETILFFDAVMAGLPNLTPYLQGRHDEQAVANFADGHSRVLKTRLSPAEIMRGDGQRANLYCLIEVGAYYDGGASCESSIFGIADRRRDGRACWRCPNRPRTSGWYMAGNCE